MTHMQIGSTFKNMVAKKQRLQSYQVKAIRYQYWLQSMDPKDIANYWGISKYTVMQIMNGRLHKNTMEEDMAIVRASHAKVQQLVDDAYNDWQNIKAEKEV